VDFGVGWRCGVAEGQSGDGPGVPDDQTERILERGQRLDTTIPGQGIGLAVAAEIVRSYEGSISIHRSDLGGARFSLCLPLLPITQ
jgi:two-component system sensor histidine kinase PhoQ